jgi:hypothetical protein
MAVELKLEAKSRNEELVLNYLKETATNDLAEKINNGKKTLRGCWNFITSEAKKRAVSGCACIEDKEVFGWATHYFWEDAIEECKTAPTTVKTVATKPQGEAKKKTPPKNSEAQVSIFDMFAGE